MRVFINIFVCAFMAFVVSTFEFGEEMYLFLPMLKNLQPPPSCPVNEYWKVCVSNCSNCEQRGKCIVTSCELSGCDCAPNFYRVTPDGPCEPVANCPQTECGENEVFRDCGPMCEKCSTLPCKMISCDHKCYCKEGYRRNDEGLCIPQEECPKRVRCIKHEVWSSSGPVDEFCIQGEKGGMENVTQDIEQCYCAEGYRRKVLGHCVEEKKCLEESSIYEVRNETYTDCVPNCNTTCRNYGNPNCTEDDNCYKGYFCNPGFLRNDFGTCIPMENCTLDLDQVKLVNSPSMDYEEKSITATAILEEESTTVTTSDTFTDITGTTDNIATGATGSNESGENHSTVSPSPDAIVSAESYAEEKSKTSNNKETKNVNVAEPKGVSKDNEDDDTFENEEI